MHTNQDPNNLEIVAKVVITGDPSVGKTSLRKRYLGKGFASSYLPTLGADFAVQKIEYDEQTTLAANIWDLAGQKSFKNITKHYLKNTDGALIVFDLSRAETYESVTSWLEQIYKAVLWPFKPVPVMIVGNKVDLERREVERSEVERLVHQLQERNAQITYLETSAKTGENVPLAFEQLGEELVKIIREKANKS